MAWTAPKTFSAGDVLTSSDMNTYVRDNMNAIAAVGVAGASSHTPTWTAASVSPAIGNGTIAGAYTQNGKTVTYWFYVAMGTTTTYGTGEWYIDLPVTAANSTSYGLAPGTVWSYDSSAGTRNASFCWLQDTSKIQFASHGATTNWDTSNPWTWAQGDTFIGCFVYEAA